MRALDRIDFSSLSAACPVAYYCQAASTLQLILKTSTHVTRAVNMQKIKNMPLVKIETGHLSSVYSCHQLTRDQ